MFRVDNCSINDALVNLSSCLCIGCSVFMIKVGLLCDDCLHLRSYILYGSAYMIYGVIICN
jgi:hypothetical protein